MAADMQIAAEIVAKNQTQAGLTAAAGDVKTAAKEIASSLGEANAAAREAGSIHEMVADKLREHGRELKGTSKLAKIVARDLAMLGVDAKGAGKEIGMFVGAFGLGGGLGLAIEAVKYIAHAFTEASEAEKKATEELKEYRDETAKLKAETQGLWDKLFGLTEADKKLRDLNAEQKKLLATQQQIKALEESLAADDVHRAAIHVGEDVRFKQIDQLRKEQEAYSKRVQELAKQESVARALEDKERAEKQEEIQRKQSEAGNKVIDKDIEKARTAAKKKEDEATAAAKAGAALAEHHAAERAAIELKWAEKVADEEVKINLQRDADLAKLAAHPAGLDPLTGMDGDEGARAAIVQAAEDAKFQVREKAREREKAEREKALQEESAETVAGLREQLEEYRGNGAMRIQILKAIAAEEAKVYGDASKQAMKAARDITKEEHVQAKERMTEIASIAQTMGTSIGGAFIDAARGAKSFGQAMADVAKQVVQLVVQMVIKSVTAKAADAAAGAAESQSGIPIVGPALAIGAMSAMLAAVMGLLSNVTSSSGGYEVPGNVSAALGVLHPDETVLTADLSKGLKEMIRGGGAGGGGHTFVFQISGLDGPSIERVVRGPEFQRHLIRSVGDLRRNGRPI